MRRRRYVSALPVVAAVVILQLWRATAAADPPADATCSIIVTASSLRVSCQGAPAAVALAPLTFMSKAGTVVVSSNVKRDDAACQAAAGGLKAAMKICSSDKVLAIVNSSINGVVWRGPAVPPQQTGALAIVSKGFVVLNSIVARGVSGATAVLVHAALGATVTNSTFDSNTAPSSTGGGLAVVVSSSGARVVLRGNSFTNNTAFSGCGAAVAAAGLRQLQVLLTGNNTFTRNRAVGSSAGALLVNASRAVAARVSVTTVPARSRTRVLRTLS
jgi:hypothetical protein